MLVGDAAGLASSVTYGGIYPAFASGKLAGEVGLKGMSSGSREPFKRYDRLLRKQPYFQKNRKKDHEMVYSAEKGVLELVGEMADGRSMDDIGLLSGFLFLIRKKAVSDAIPLLRMYRYAKKRTKYGI